jgi:hypothetical protein
LQELTVRRSAEDLPGGELLVLEHRLTVVHLRDRDAKQGSEFNNLARRMRARPWPDHLIQLINVVCAVNVLPPPRILEELGPLNYRGKALELTDRVCIQPHVAVLCRLNGWRLNEAERLASGRIALSFEFRAGLRGGSKINRSEPR